MGDRGKPQHHLNGRSRRPALSNFAGPNTPGSGKQSAHAQPDKEQQPDSQTPDTEATASANEMPDARVDISQTAQETAGDGDVDEQPTPPGLRAIPSTQPAPAPPLEQTQQTSTAHSYWTPPSTEEQVEKFLSEIAEIEPPPVPEPQESAPTPFFLLADISPEAAERKKAITTPFLSQIQSNNLASHRTGAAHKRPRKRIPLQRRRRIIWLATSTGVLVIIVVVALIVFLLLRR